MEEIIWTQVVYLCGKYFSISDREVWLNGFISKSLCSRKGHGNQLIAHECFFFFFAEMENALRMEFFTEKERGKLILSWNQMLWVALFNFPLPKHISSSFQLAYFTQLNLEMTNISQSITDLQRILPGSFSSAHIHSSHVMTPHGSFVPFEFHN